MRLGIFCRNKLVYLPPCRLDCRPSCRSGGIGRRGGFKIRFSRSIVFNRALFLRDISNDPLPAVPLESGTKSGTRMMPIILSHWTPSAEGLKRVRANPFSTFKCTGGRCNGTAVRVADLNRAKYDKLLFKVRKQLLWHDFPRGTIKIRCGLRIFG